MDDEIPVHGDSHASSSHETSLEPIFKRREDLGKHSVYTHFPKDRNCEICKRTKITRAPCRRRNSGAVPRAENVGDLITADHKVLSEGCESRNSHRYAVVVQDLATQWIQAKPCKNKNFTRNPEKLAHSSWSPTGILKSFTLTIPWNSAKLVKISPGIIARSTPHRSETNGIAERAVRKVKEGTSAVLLQSGLNESWWADSMECETYLRNVTDLLSDGKTALWKTFWATIERTDYSIWFISWISSYYCEGPVKNPSIWKESLTWIVPSDTLCTREEFGRVTYWLQTLRSWRRWTHQKSTQKDSMRRRWYFPKKENLLFQSQMDESKLSGGDQELENIHLGTASTNSRRE